MLSDRKPHSVFRNYTKDPLHMHLGSLWASIDYVFKKTLRKHPHVHCIA